MSRFRFSPNEQGDTIVEVLLAIVIVSAVLTGAFVVISKNSQQVRDSEEHAQALQLLQGQVEQVRTILACGEDATCPTNASALLAQTGTFCIDSVTKLQVANHGHSPDPCHNGSFYDISITHDGTDRNLYHFNIDWPSVYGSSNSNVQLAYRMYPAP